MIGELDTALRDLLSTRTYPGERIQVDLDPPSKDWSARRSGPVLNLFLTDVRENTDKRTANFRDVRNDEGVIVSRHPASRVFMFSYALSAWTSRPEDDHELLGAALVALLEHDYIPEEFCTGHLLRMAQQIGPARLKVGGNLFSERLATELWSAIGGEYRPILALTASVKLEAGMGEVAGPPQTEPPRFSLTDTRTGTTTQVEGPMPADAVAASEAAESGEESELPRRTRRRMSLSSSPTDAVAPPTRGRKQP